MASSSDPVQWAKDKFDRFKIATSTLTVRGDASIIMQSASSSGTSSPPQLLYKLTYPHSSPSTGTADPSTQPLSKVEMDDIKVMQQLVNRVFDKVKDRTMSNDTFEAKFKARPSGSNKQSEEGGGDSSNGTVNPAVLLRQARKLDPWSGTVAKAVYAGRPGCWNWQHGTDQEGSISGITKKVLDDKTEIKWPTGVCQVMDSAASASSAKSAVIFELRVDPPEDVASIASHGDETEG